jgi:phosphoglycolate phosphatase-like HAD superfamily hydrolase
LLQAATEMDLDLAGSYMVGDALSDLLAGRRAGCRPFLVLTGRGFQQLLPALNALDGDFTIARNLMQVTTHILRSELGMVEQAERLDSYAMPRYSQVMPRGAQVSPRYSHRSPVATGL